MRGQYIWFQMNLEEESDIESLFSETEGITDEAVLEYLAKEDRKLQKEIDDWQSKAIYIRSVHY